MQVDDMRWLIRKAYPGQSWKNKVDCMDDNQVIAIYYSLERRKNIEPKPKKKKENNVVQLRLEDFYED